jgi:hypothetical protein
MKPIRFHGFCIFNGEKMVVLGQRPSAPNKKATIHKDGGFFVSSGFMQFYG